MKTALRTTISLLLVLWLALTFLPARPAQAAEGDASIPPDLLLATLDATSRPPVAGSQTGGLSFTFEAGGLQAAGLDWGVALSKLGREDQVRALGAAEATQTERQTEYRRPELTEWRRATAFGLQQGFTIRSAPSGKGALTLRLSLSTDLRGRLDADKRGLSFPTEDGRTLRYDHLLAWDANGTALDAELVYAPGEIRIIVQDAGAAYPLTIDPLIYLEQKVIASDGAADDYFGDSVALNAAGDTAIVGTPWDDIGGNAHQGSAYVFARSGGVWSQQAKLTASDGAKGDEFGGSVALNAAGDTAIVGACLDDVGANRDQGSAYVFAPSAGNWIQQAKLTASDGAAYDYFGVSVALNAAGDTAIVGAPRDDVGANADQGSAYFYQADDHAKKTVTYRSNGAQDGWVLESSETSNKGGTLNSTAKTFRLGDDAARKQYRAILSFNTASLPDNAVITKVTLKVKRQRVVGGGNPVKKFKGFIMDIRNGTFGAARLQKPDFQTRADRSTAAMKKNAKNNKWYTLDLSGLKAFVNRQGLTQGRLRFKLDDDNNKVANYLSLYSGNATKANRPQLIVEYYVP